MTEIDHGTEAGYYQHRNRGVPFPEDQGGEPCGCRAAKAAAERARYVKRPKRPKSPKPADPRLICPVCGGPKTREAERCRHCPRPQPRRAVHGTESGYYHELRHGQVPCAACTEAHREAQRERRRRSGRGSSSRPSPRQYRLCIDCGKRITPEARRCVRCSNTVRVLDGEPPPMWRLSRGIWRAA